MYYLSECEYFLHRSKRYDLPELSKQTECGTMPSIQLLSINNNGGFQIANILSVNQLSYIDIRYFVAVRSPICEHGRRVDDIFALNAAPNTTFIKLGGEPIRASQLKKGLAILMCSPELQVIEGSAANVGYGVVESITELRDSNIYGVELEADDIAYNIKNNFIIANAMAIQALN